MLEIPPLPDGTILLVEVGSTAHGTGIPGGEDHDEIDALAGDESIRGGPDRSAVEACSVATHLWHWEAARSAASA
jgi:hypothetical protein